MSEIKEFIIYHLQNNERTIIAYIEISIGLIFGASFMALCLGYVGG